MAIKARFPLLLLLLGIVFLALVCVSSGVRHPCHEKCLKRCNSVNEASERHECRSRCEGWPERCEEEEEQEEEDERPWHKERGRRERGRQEGEREEEERQHLQPRRQEEEEEQQQRPGRRERGRQEGEREEEERQRPGHRQPRHEREQEEQQQRPEHRRPRHEEEQEEEEEWRGHYRHQDPEERERVRIRRERRQEQEEEREQRHRSRESEEEEEGSSSSESQRRKNPFFFSSNNRFQTLFKNENGRIRLLQRFDKRSNLFQNLKNYRLLEYRSKPHTLFLPQHTDADSILVVLSGRAIVTLVNPNDRNSFNLERGDVIKLPAGTTVYLANQDNNEDLRVVDLVIPVNRPGQFQSFFPSSSQNQQSYFNEFSRDILEASFNTNYKEIERVLLEDQQSQEVNPIVKVSRKQIEELRRNAKSSSKKSSSSEFQPFNLRSHDPIYSNKFGKFFEITPEKNPQLQNLSLSLSSVEIREGAIILPHYNSRALVILVVNEGKGHIELVGQRNEHQRRQQQHQREEDEDEDEEEQRQEEDKRSRQLQRYRARLSSGDVFVIPASNPVAINASSDLNIIGFGINAENNQRNFLAGEKDNVISQIHRPVKELAFPGSVQEVERLIKNQKQSYFASAQPQEREEESQRRRGPLSSILEAFY